LKSRKRIGVYAGTFDPVHAGHISFALQAIHAGKLDEVIFLPERQPRFKQGSEHFGHRVAMLTRATRPHRKLHVLELTDKHFSVRKTLPALRRLFKDADLVFLVGSDVLTHLKDWPGADILLQTSELLVGVRGDEPLAWAEHQIADLPIPPRASLVIRSHAASISSGLIRSALRRNKTVAGILPSVQRYARQNWLYVSVISV
jgi:nicotinate-nucleotide adenylyltransferase